MRIFYESKNANFTLEVYENAWNGEWQLRWTFSPSVKMISEDLYDISQEDVPFEVKFILSQNSRRKPGHSGLSGWKELYGLTRLGRKKNQGR